VASSANKWDGIQRAAPRTSARRTVSEMWVRDEEWRPFVLPTRFDPLVLSDNRLFSNVYDYGLEVGIVVKNFKFNATRYFD
jgi:hypothetical protein